MSDLAIELEAAIEAMYKAMQAGVPLSTLREKVSFIYGYLYQCTTKIPVKWIEEALEREQQILNQSASLEDHPFA